MTTGFAGKVVRAFFLLAATLSVAIACSSKAAPAPKVLPVTVSLKDTKACKGALRLNISIEIQNTGKEPLAVPLSSVGYYYSYLPAPRVKDGSQRTDVGFSGVTPLGSGQVVTIEPRGSYHFAVNIQFPPNAPATTNQFEFSLTFFAQPPKHEPKGTKMFRGEVQSNTIKFDYADCAASSL